MNDARHAPTSERWAHLRFSVVGPLLAAPPEPGRLQQALRDLAARTWLHPTTGEPTRFCFSTIERWYYRARRERRDPVGSLRRQSRSDAGRHRALSVALADELVAQYHAHDHWSAQLHHDNLAALVRKRPELGELPSYSSVRRFLKARGLVRKRRRKGRAMSAGEQRAAERFEQRETRSYEAAHVHGLWHADFHHGSLLVLRSNGDWVRPICLGFLDDRSRIACHVQWYLAESTETFVHGLCQALQKHGLPRSLLTDNGSPMTAAEVEQGLLRLSILHDTTLPYSPHQNGKQEVFWAQLEGRLLAMLTGEANLTLDVLNEATCAWVELEYHRRVHSGISVTPLERLREGPSVGRDCPGSDDLRLTFTSEHVRRQRRSDGTISLAAKRFEVPARLRHAHEITVRFARWDLSRVHLVDPTTGKALERLLPLNATANADGRRRVLPRPDAKPKRPPSTPPLLAELVEKARRRGHLPGYLPHDDSPDSPETKP